MREGGVLTLSTRLQHLGDSEVLLEQKRLSGAALVRVSPKAGTPEISPSCYVLR